MALTFATRPEAGARALLQHFVRKRDLAGLSPVLAQSGHLEARLAVTKKDVRRAQKLRYRVFFEEGGAIADPTARLIRRDVCRFDSVCDHLIVVDKTLRGAGGSPKVVGVYRLLRQEVAERNFGFYSASEFEVDALIARRPGVRLLEVGRACIASSHRGKHVLDLLWRGIWAYARHHGVDALIGCASLPGADPAAHRVAIRALADDGEATFADARSLARALPPLVKGYFRLGATFSPAPAVDRAFGRRIYSSYMPLCDIEERYLQRFGGETRPMAA